MISSVSAQPLSPDFFLPDEVLKTFPDFDSSALYNEKSNSGSSTESVFDKIKSVLNEEVVKKTSGMYAFHIIGKLTTSKAYQ